VRRLDCQCGPENHPLDLSIRATRRIPFPTPGGSVKTVKNRDVFERRPFSIDELRPVVAVADEEWQSLIKCGLYISQRLGDLSLLTWSQIDLERDEIRLTAQKTGKSLLIPIAAPLREHLLSLTTGGDNPRAPVHPRAFEIVTKTGRVGTLSNQFPCATQRFHYSRMLAFLMASSWL
jgi:integrase